MPSANDITLIEFCLRCVDFYNMTRPKVMFYIPMIKALWFKAYGVFSMKYLFAKNKVPNNKHLAYDDFRT